MDLAATRAAGGTVATRYDPKRTSRANMKSRTDARLPRMRRNCLWQYCRTAERLRESKSVVKLFSRILATAGHESRRTSSMPLVSSTGRTSRMLSNMFPTYRFLVCRMLPMYTCTAITQGSQRSRAIHLHAATSKRWQGQQCGCQ
jgi:hypothetical protein